MKVGDKVFFHSVGGLKFEATVLKDHGSDVLDLSIYDPEAGRPFASIYVARGAGVGEWAPKVAETEAPSNQPHEEVTSNGSES